MLIWCRCSQPTPISTLSAGSTSALVGVRRLRIVPHAEETRPVGLLPQAYVLMDRRVAQGPYKHHDETLQPHLRHVEKVAIEKLLLHLSAGQRIGPPPRWSVHVLFYSAKTEIVNAKSLWTRRIFVTERVGRLLALMLLCMSAAHAHYRTQYWLTMPW
jgi:hypothetical protein